MLEFLNLYRADAQHIAGLLLGLALWRHGAAPERAVGAVFVGCVILPAMIGRQMGFEDLLLFGSQWWIYMLFDLAAAAGFIAIALKANRTYPLFIAGFQLVSMSAHAMRGLVDAVAPLAYAILAIGPSYGQLLVLLGGLIFHCHRQRRYGPYRGWRVSPPARGWGALADPRRDPHV